MAEQPRQVSGSALMAEMGITPQEISRRLAFVGFGPADLGRIVAVSGLVLAQVEACTAAFFDHLSTLDESRALFSNRELVNRAKRLKSEHIGALVRGEYGEHYVEQRIELGLLYSSIGLEPGLFLGAFNQLLKHIGTLVTKHFERAPLDGFEHFMALEKIAFFDIGIIVDVLVFERQRVIRRQQVAIRELSTPVLKIRDHLLLLPIIGVIDAQRARLLTDALLHSIRASRARVVVMDATGVGTIDSDVAGHVLQTVAAARLMGARVIVTGLSTEVAQALIMLGIDLAQLGTAGDLQSGIEEGERFLRRDPDE
jgi:rsbT co-antagonist protein RsbR